MNRNCLRIIYHSKNAEFHICADRSCKGEYEEIHDSYSHHHAQKSGWVFTDSPKYSLPRKPLTDAHFINPMKGAPVWVCPICAKGKFE